MNKVSREKKKRKEKKVTLKILKFVDPFACDLTMNMMYIFQQKKNDLISSELYPTISQRIKFLALFFIEIPLPNFTLVDNLFLSSVLNFPTKLELMGVFCSSSKTYRRTQPPSFQEY